MEEDYPDIEAKRIQRFKDVIARRQPDLTVVLENVHDPHNVGAVLRSCDAVGITDVYILYTHDILIERGVDIGRNASSGSVKWINIHTYTDVHECFKDIQAKYTSIYATHLGADSVPLYDVDLSVSTALVFGNEHQGVSKETLSYCTGNFLIPQMGMVQSLNISVACAVTIFEASRQRQAKGKYDQPFDHANTFQTQLLDQYIEKHRSKKGYVFKNGIIEVLKN